MDHIGIDVHKIQSRVCILNERGERQQRGRITKAGNSRARSLLIEAAWLILRGKRSDTLALRTWAERVAVRRGRRVAAVALARRLSRILYAMWPHGLCVASSRLR
jgi:transposase